MKGHPVNPVHPVCGAEYPHRAFTSASGGGNSAVPSGKPTFRGHSNQHRTTQIHGRSITEGQSEEILAEECRSLFLCREEESGHR